MGTKGSTFPSSPSSGLPFAGKGRYDDLPGCSGQSDGWKTSCSSLVICQEEAEIRGEFRKLDTDRSGFITKGGREGQRGREG